jgi:hypothetical protein
MLANNLTLEDEEAVQEELRAMQDDIVKDTLPAIELPAVPTMEPITSVEKGASVFVVTNFSNHDVQSQDHSLIK